MKLLKVLVIGLVIAAMAVPVIAEDRFSLSGQMRVRAFMYDVDKESTNFDDSGAWNDQRMRISGKIAVAEGVSVHFRFDATESDENSSNNVAWGGSSNKYNAAGTYVGGSVYQYSSRRADIQFDKAYLQLVKNGVTFQAGQLYFGGFGHTRDMLDVVGTGFVVKYKGFYLGHVKRLDENAGNDSFGSSSISLTSRPNNDGDVSLTALKYDYKGDGFALTPMLAYNYDDNYTDYDLLGFGLAGSANLGPVYLKGELNIFDGERAGSIDLKGNQLYLDASMAATDTVRVGAMFLWAEGQDGGDQQVTNMNNDGLVNWTFADWHPESYGYWSGEFVREFDIYDPSGAGAGVTAGSLYADVKVNDALSMKFAGMVYQTEDDDIADVDGYTLNAGLAYKLMKNTTLTTHLNYNSEDIDTGYDDYTDDYLQLISGLVVKF